MTHARRESSLGNDVSLAGDFMTGGSAATTLTANRLASAGLSGVAGRLGLYGLGFIFGGELYSVGEKFHQRHNEIDPLRPNIDVANPLKSRVLQVIGARNKSLLVDDD